MSDYYLKSPHRRYNRLDARSVRRRRQRWLLGVAAVAVVFIAYYVGSKPLLKGRTSTRHASAADNQAVAVPFTVVNGTNLTLALPASKKEILAIGYHQAYNPRALSLVSKMALLTPATTSSVSRAASAGRLSVFVMESRGRGSRLDSSVDVALKTGSAIMSPVTGRVLAVAPYLLYGRINDFRIDIAADGYPGFKIAVTHVDKPTVAVGQTMVAGATPLGIVRSLGINSQIDQYLGKVVDHVHIQANPIEAKPVAASGD